ncbi:hypothetical protein [Planomonospora venezuelensis]|uniref:Secreted protein n=1 Tax=Planomonospora venezuelensis TaxID=1999 RepID=A0A841D172_PLAVE|nr:hypothetical protein [Planomonospora venezuelensis]MBB5963470.1 hypothetical protein [Planomonospora venezuelensis]GIN02194.1 hypothetical protein Pve01_38520 [Planomonospora venezuelensis]
MKHTVVRRLGRTVLAAALAGGMLLTGGAAAAVAESAAAPVPAPERKLGPFGYRGVKLEMSLREARETGKIVRTARSGRCSEWNFRTGPNRRNGPDLFISRRHGVAAIFAAEGTETRRGIEIGSTRRQLERAYPDLERVASGYFIASVPRNPEAHFAFLLSGGEVRQMALVLNRQDCGN